MKHIFMLFCAFTLLGAYPAAAADTVHSHDSHSEEMHHHEHAEEMPSDETAPAAAETQRGDIKVTVFGLVCDYCARAIEKTFMKQDAVESVHVDLDNFLVSIDLKEGQALDDATVTKLVEDAGYTVKNIERHDGQLQP